MVRIGVRDFQTLEVPAVSGAWKMAPGLRDFGASKNCGNKNHQSRLVGEILWR